MYKPIYPKKMPARNCWEVYSSKIGREVRFLSDLEYDYWFLIEADPEIIEFCEHPLDTSYYTRKGIVKLDFHLWLKYRDNRQKFVIFQYTNHVDISSQSFLLLQEWCEQHNSELVFLTTKEVRQNQIYLQNMKLIVANHKVSSKKKDHFMLHELKSYLENMGKVTVGEIHQTFPIFSLTEIIQAISWYLYNGNVFANTKVELLGSKTEVWWNGETSNY